MLCFVFFFIVSLVFFSLYSSHTLVLFFFYVFLLLPVFLFFSPHFINVLYLHFSVHFPPAKTSHTHTHSHTYTHTHMSAFVLQLWLSWMPWPFCIPSLFQTHLCYDVRSHGLEALNYDVWFCLTVVIVLHLSHSTLLLILDVHGLCVCITSLFQTHFMRWC